MKCACSLAAALFLLSFTVPAFAQSGPSVPPLMNFQGRLAKPDGTPVTDGNHTVVFTLYDAVTGGTVKWTETKTVTARNGVFAVLLGSNTPLNETVFAADRWLELSVDGVTLAPRQRIVSQAFAFKANLANTVPDASITGAKIASGTITSDKFAANVFNPLAWLLGGNSGTDGTQFLGTTDNQPLVFKVNGRQAMRYSYAENKTTQGGEYRSINVLGGSDINSIAAGVVGATIAGGGLNYFNTGASQYPNMVTADLGTIGGGFGNTVKGYGATVGGGYSNSVGGREATVAGGGVNTANGLSATIGGGFGNTAAGYGDTVGGGIGNGATNEYAVVAGGNGNSATGLLSTVGGGSQNSASGGDSTVAGGGDNIASGGSATVAGGFRNVASGSSAIVAGG